MPGMRTQTIAVLAAAAMVVGACSAAGGEGTEATRGTDSADRSVSTTTTMPVPPGGRQPTADDPLSILFAGDSIGLELAAPSIAALGGGGSAATFFVGNPSITRDAARNGLWEFRLEESDPDVIVMLIGVWERMVFGRDQLAGQTVSEYRTQVIDPFVDLITSQGAEVIWVTSPLVQDPTATSQIGFLNEAFHTLGQSDERVHFVDAVDTVANPDGTFADVLYGTDGTAERVRRIDGTHLCPGGAVRMAEPVIATIVERWNIPVAPNWQNGSWRSAEPFEDAAEACPAVG